MFLYLLKKLCAYYFAAERLPKRISVDLLEDDIPSHFVFSTCDQFDLVFRTCRKSGSTSSFIVRAFNSLYVPGVGSFSAMAFEIGCACLKIKVYIL